MEVTEDILEITFSGSNIRPESLKSTEVAEIIAAYEHSLLSIISRNNPEVNIDDVFISLVDIKENSAHFKFKPTVKNIFFAAATIINIAINTNHFENLPYKTVDSLNQIWSFTKRKNCIAEFTSSESIPSAKITPEIEIKISEEFFYQGETNIYGIVERAGGTIPKIRLKMDNGNIIYITVDQKTAKDLAENLYEVIGLKGLAKWRKEDFFIEDFVIKEIIPFKDSSSKESFAELRNTIGEYWDIQNVNEFLFDIRYREE